MKLTTLKSVAIAVGLASPAFGQTAVSPVVGYTTETLQGGSDTSITVPFFGKQTSATVTAAVAGAAAGQGDLTLNTTLADLSSAPNIVLITSGPLLGEYFEIVSNTADTITIDLLGAPVADLNGQSLDISLAATLGNTFPGGQSVFASTGVNDIGSSVFRRDVSTPGINLPPSEQFVYFDLAGDTNDGWFNLGNLAAGNQDDTVLFPDEFYVVRHPVGSADTSLVVSGAVLAESFTVALPVTNSAAGQDISVGIPYPVDLTPRQTQLFESGAFAASSGVNDVQDQLLIFDDNSPGINKVPAATFVYFDLAGDTNDGWFNLGNLAGGVMSDAPVIPAGTGLIVRKAVGSPVGVETFTFTAPF